MEAMTRKHYSRRTHVTAFYLLAECTCVAFTAVSQTAIAGENNDYAKSVAIQSDGKIIAAGYAAIGHADNIALVRYNADGTLDTSFNGTGKVTTAVGDGDCRSEALVLQSDGKIVVAGYSFNSSDHAVFTLVRYNANGTLDTSFGESGK